MIYENDDEPGYSTVPPASLSACNAILSSQEQACIAEAASFMIAGRSYEAERARDLGGYGFRHRRRDREDRGLC